MNEFLFEFSREIDIDEFAKWINANIGTFHKNLKKNEKGKKPLRKWVKMFLLWTEYKENANG
jgi:hypothetical protein